jgi:hypothetical protein
VTRLETEGYRLRTNHSITWLLVAAVGGVVVVLTVLNRVDDVGARAIIIGALLLFFGAAAAIVAELRASRLLALQVIDARLPAPSAEPAPISVDLLQDWHEPNF